MEPAECGLREKKWLFGCVTKWSVRVAPRIYKPSLFRALFRCSSSQLIIYIYISYITVYTKFETV